MSGATCLKCGEVEDGTILHRLVSRVLIDGHYEPTHPFVPAPAETCHAIVGGSSGDAGGTLSYCGLPVVWEPKMQGGADWCHVDWPQDHVPVVIPAPVEEAAGPSPHDRLGSTCPCGHPVTKVVGRFAEQRHDCLWCATVHDFDPIEEEAAGPRSAPKTWTNVHATTDDPAADGIWKAIHDRIGWGYLGISGARESEENEDIRRAIAAIRADGEARLLSGTSVFEGGEMRALTWEEVAEKARAEVSALRAYHSLLSDLSRCEHGRHLGDVCSACGGPSVGNAILTPGMVIGHDISGRPITVPAKAQLATADDWLAALDAEASQ